MLYTCTLYESDISWKIHSRLMWTSLLPKLFFSAHRALDDSIALKRLLFESELKHHLHLLEFRSAKQQRGKFESMVFVRVQSGQLIYKLGKHISSSMAKKIVRAGLTYELLRRRSALLSKERFVQMLKEKHLSKQCCDKLVAYFCTQ